MNEETKMVLKYVYGRKKLVHTLPGDMNIFECVDAFREFLLAAGYHPNTVDEALNEQD